MGSVYMLYGRLPQYTDRVDESNGKKFGDDNFGSMDVKRIVHGHFSNGIIN